MMHRHSTISGLLLTAVLLAGCSEKPAPVAATPPPAPATTAAQPETDNANVTRAKLNAGGVAAGYSAHFDAEKLVRIDEQRQPQGGAALSGEYTFQGARLLHYRGAKITQPATLDLEFDMQGVLQQGRGPDVTDEEIAAIRNRAQLLRSHALAQRASRAHTSGY
jgi:hypothetical protein